MSRGRVIQSLAAIYEQEHFVQFYSRTESLLDSLRSFVGAGILEGDTCLVVALEDHRIELEARLIEAGLDLAAAQANDRYLTLGTTEILTAWAPGGVFDYGRFMEQIGGILRDALTQGRRIRVFNEVGALLRQRGDFGAAFRLEQAWNDAGRRLPLTLFCAYSLEDFDAESGHEELIEVSRGHSTTIAPKLLDLTLG